MLPLCYHVKFQGKIQISSSSWDMSVIYCKVLDRGVGDHVKPGPDWIDYREIDAEPHVTVWINGYIQSRRDSNKSSPSL